MKRLHIFSTIIVLGALIVGSLSGIGGRYTMIMSDSLLQVDLRSVLLVVFLGLALTRRPRTIMLRALCAVTAVIVLGYVLGEMSAAELGVIDALAYFLSIAVLMIEAIEPDDLAYPRHQIMLPPRRRLHA